MTVRVDVTHDHCEFRPNMDREHNVTTIIAPLWTAKFPQNSTEFADALGPIAYAAWKELLCVQ